MSDIRAIIFDCFGVLWLDPSTAFYESILKNYHNVAAEIGELDKQYDYGLIDADEHAQAVSQLGNIPLERVRAGIRSTHQANRELIDYAASLRPRYKLGMLSNIGRGGMDAFFSEADRARLFDDTVLSGEVMLIKPNPELFRLAAERLGVRTDQCIMIDDRLDNCDGAERAGMKAICHQSNHRTKNAIENLLT